jgi:hypothetical protein
MSNLPSEPKSDSAEEVKEFFDQYQVQNISYPSNQVDAVIGFFESRGFEKNSAISVATILLQQAKIDQVNVFELIDTLQGLTKTQLSNIVATILNYNRQKISTLGFRVENTQEQFERRNIIDDRPAPLAPVNINIAVKNNFSVTGLTFDSNSITWDRI